jgi:predicted aspartyl protease
MDRHCRPDQGQDMVSEVVGEVRMGSFNVTWEVPIPTLDRQPAAVTDVMVDTGSEYTWLPEDVLRGAGIPVSKRDLGFAMADGTAIKRDVGYAFLRCGEFEAVDEVVYGRPDDLRLLGARTLEGFAARRAAEHAHGLSSAGLVAPCTGDVDGQSVHAVTLSSFFVGGYEVTQAQQQTVMPSPAPAPTAPSPRPARPWWQPPAFRRPQCSRHP